MSVSSALNDAAYASERARITTSTDGAPARNRVRTSSRNRRFNRLRSTADPEYRGTTIPTRGCPRGEAIARTSRCMVRTRFPSRATPCSSIPRVSRWLRGKRRPCRDSCRSGAGVLARDPNSQPLPALLSATAESLAPPLCGHASAESMRPDAPLVTGTIGGLTHENSRLEIRRKPAPTVQQKQSV
jgi:hypothetical protein